MLNASHANRPDSPSLELTLLTLELALVGRRAGEAAVDGLDFSACASYISRKVATDRFRVNAGARPVFGRSSLPLSFGLLAKLEDC